MEYLRIFGSPYLQFYIPMAFYKDMNGFEMCYLYIKIVSPWTLTSTYYNGSTLMFWHFGPRDNSQLAL